MNVLKKKLNKKGFTLAELLIVVAIIAVLVAIAIPVFSGQINKANDAVKDANYRAAKAQAAISYMMTNESGDKYYTYTVSDTGDITLGTASASGTDGATDNTSGTVKVSGSQYTLN